MDYAGITSLLTFVGLLAGFQIACAIVSVAGSSISLSHSLKEAPKRTDFIVFSSLGLAFGIIGFFNLIFGILGVISTVVSMAKDSWDRKLRGYVLTMVLVTAIIGGGYSYFMNTLTSDVMNEIDGLSDVGLDTISQLNGDTTVVQTSDGESEANAEDSKYREVLKDDVSQLNDLMKQILNYKKNLQSLSVAVPVLPESIIGDTFSTNEDRTQDVSIIYQPSHIFVGGRDFDWVNKTHVNDCFVPSDVNDADDYEVISTDGWKMLDGSEIDFEAYDTSTDAAMKSIHDNIQGYVDAVNAYGQLKYQYQTVDIQEYYRFLYMN